jgi:hypothetical protein
VSLLYQKQLLSYNTINQHAYTPEHKVRNRKQQYETTILKELNEKVYKAPLYLAIYPNMVQNKEVAAFVKSSVFNNESGVAGTKELVVSVT